MNEKLLFELARTTKILLKGNISFYYATKVACQKQHIPHDQYAIKTISRRLNTEKQEIEDAKKLIADRDQGLADP